MPGSEPAQSLLLDCVFRWGLQQRLVAQLQELGANARGQAVAAV